MNLQNKQLNIRYRKSVAENFFLGHFFWWGHILWIVNECKLKLILGQNNFFENSSRNHENPASFPP